MRIDIRPTIQEDIPAVTYVLSQATLHKAAHNDYLWGDNPYTYEEVEKRLESGGLYTVFCDDVIAGTATLTEADERVWGDDGKSEEKALYIHGLATSDSVRGKHVGEKVINWVIEKAREEDRKAVRLDCSYTNRRLCHYYEIRGFVEIRRRNIPRKVTARDLRDPIYQVALMERSVT